MKCIIEKIISLTILIIAYVTLSYVITIDCYDLNKNSDNIFSNYNIKTQQQQYQENSNNNNNNENDDSIEMLTIEPERWQQSFSTTPETDNHGIGNNDGSFREDERSSTPSTGRMRRRRLGKKRKRIRQQQIQSSTHYDEITEGQLILNEEIDSESTKVPPTADTTNTRRDGRRKKQYRGRDNENPANNFQHDQDEPPINPRLRDYEELIPEQTTYRLWNKNDHPERRPPPKYERVREPVDRDRQLNELRERHRQRDELATATEQNKSYRRPYSAARREEQNDEHGNSGSSDLKAILKQSGGLSLSEILQQRNLSLADLLKGKQNALAALTPTIPNPTVGFDVNADGDHLPMKNVRRLPGATLTTNSYNLVPTNSWQPTDDSKPPPRRLPTFNAPPKPPNELPPKTEIESKYDTNIRRISPPQLTITSTTTTTTTTTQEPEIVTELIATKATQLAETQNSPEETLPSRAALHPPIDYVVTEIAPTIALQSKDANKPIREIVSGFRPDLSNSKRRIPFSKLRTTTVTAIEPTVGIEVTSTASIVGKPQRWDEIGKNLLNRDKIRNIGKVENVTTIEMKDDKTELETETAVQVGGSLNEEVITSVHPVLPESQSVPDIQIIRDLKNRPPFRPRLRQPRPTTSTEPNTTPALSAETENYPKRPIIRPIKKEDSQEEKINKSETNANIIEKFSTFEDRKQKTVASIEEIFDGINNKEITSRSDEDLGSEINNTKSSFVLTNKTTKQLDVTERNPSLFADITSIRSPVDDRTDLLELLGDRRSGGRLAKVLAQRNMSFDELIEHRQRGSSQLHLAEIFHKSNSTNDNDFIKTTINLPHLTPQQQRKDKRLGYDIVTAFDNFPNFNLDNIKSVRPDDIKTDSQGSSYFATIINIRPTDEIKKVNHLSQQLVPPMSSASSPLSNEQSWNFDTTNYRHNHRPVMSSRSPIGGTVSTLLPTDRLKKQKLNVNDDVLQRVEQIENEVARANDLLEFDLNIGQDTRKTTAVTVETAHLPIGVKSAIVASGCIVGVSLLIFVIIFVVCRIRQRRRTKLNYNESYQTTTKSGHLPILQREMSRRNMLHDNTLSFQNLTTNMNSNHQMSMNCGGLTLNGSRCSKLNTMDPNSPEVQDYLFDAMRKPFQ